MPELSVITQKCIIITKNSIQFTATVRVEGFVFSKIRHTRVYVYDIEGPPSIIGPQTISIMREDGLMLKVQRVPEIQMVFLQDGVNGIVCMRHRTYAEASAWL